MILQQLHRQRVVFRPSPAIAIKTANKSLAVVVDLGQSAMTMGTKAHQTILPAIQFLRSCRFRITLAHGLNVSL